MTVRAALAACLLTLAPGGGSRADEGGTPFWTSGQYGSFAAVPASPGWSLQTSVYYYDGEASKRFRRSDAAANMPDTRGPLHLFQPGWAPTWKLLGGQPQLSLSFGYGFNHVHAEQSNSSGVVESDAEDSLWGGTDVQPLVSLAWSRGVANWMAYLTGNIPVGSYDSARLANLGIGHGAIDAGGAFSYFDASTGREASATLGFTYNFENHDTDYQNGVDSHLDWALSQTLRDGWQVGLVGYLYYQLSGDSGKGADLGDFESKVVAIGPKLGRNFQFCSQPWSANLRGYYELWSENRVRGFAIFATLSLPIPLGN